MTDAESKFLMIGRIANAYGNAIAAAFEKFAAEMSEAAKSLPDREYWRGYQDAMHDHAEIETRREPHDRI